MFPIKKLTENGKPFYEGCSLNIELYMT